jgi:hypothetical protein
MKSNSRDCEPGLRQRDREGHSQVVGLLATVAPLLGMRSAGTVGIGAGDFGTGNLAPPRNASSPGPEQDIPRRGTGPLRLPFSPG